ncbi:ABC transporter ATP-binding protein [Leptospira wolffii]|uniref:ABC transporter ATP-binding protein n=1 Tax=Leptospira wolffii TaxID=409998 RepID=A0ABV5BLJ1_9LEPT|nr:ABC transporter ATP-binding protein [Leptospira wolffii]TGL46409.1 ABC transporter ATP-binding protein [Leptospira wolffii]
MGSLRAENLSKIYSGKIALSPTNFEIPKNRITGLLGRNGAGKTTVLRILTGFLKPDSGNVFWNGFPLENDPIEFKKNLGYLPESAPIYPDMTVSETLDFLGKARGLEGENLRRRRKEVLEICDLRSDLHTLAGVLSRGTRQRLALAGALIHDPEIIVLDEPSSGLDPLQVSQFRSTIRNLAKDKILLFSSHILSEVEELCEHVLVLHNGNLIADRPVSDWKGKDAVLLRARTDIRTLEQKFNGTDLKISLVSESDSDREFRLESESMKPEEIFEILRSGSFSIIEYKIARKSLESAFQDWTGNP